ncbi:hypothetical protein GCM10009609_40800 [Pseudonocardia aurantiaca]
MVQGPAPDPDHGLDDDRDDAAPSRVNRAATAVAAEPHIERRQPEQREQAG